MVIFDKVGFIYRRKIEKLFEETLRQTGNPSDNIIVGVKFVSEQEIKHLNKTHRDVDKVTDVLSFPFLNIKAGEALAEFNSEVDPNGMLQLGDIVVCTAKAKAQAKQYGHSYKRELMFLITHGFLHCLGYDHMEKKEEKVMMSLTERILQKFNLGARNV